MLYLIQQEAATGCNGNTVVDVVILIEDNDEMIRKVILLR